MAPKITYRGFEIEKHAEKDWRIFEKGSQICAQPSEDFAYKWVDEEKKRRRNAN